MHMKIHAYTHAYMFVYVSMLVYMSRSACTLSGPGVTHRASYIALGECVGVHLFVYSCFWDRVCASVVVSARRCVDTMYTTCAQLASRHVQRA